MAATLQCKFVTLPMSSSIPCPLLVLTGAVSRSRSVAKPFDDPGNVPFGDAEVVNRVSAVGLRTHAVLAVCSKVAAGDMM